MTYHEFTVNGTTYDPNSWRVVRESTVVSITTADGSLIDEPSQDEVPTDDDAIRHGILWLICDNLDEL